MPEDNRIEDSSLDFLWDGMLKNNFELTKAGLKMVNSDDFTIQYWTADDFINFTKGKVNESSYTGYQIDNNVADDYSYVTIMYKGETVGVVEVPDNLETYGFHGFKKKK